MTFALQLLICAVALGLVHILLAASLSTNARGLAWAVGPRDDSAAPLSGIAGRLERASHNFQETFPLFAAAILAGIALGKESDLTSLGAQLYLWGRVAYLPLYALAIPFARTIAWTVATAGIVVVLVPLFG